MALDKRVDGIFVGGGHQALVCAAYMAEAGRDIIVLEQGLHVGGGLKTRDVTGKGFRFNLCAKGHYNVTGTPWYDDLDLSERGAKYIDPESDFSLLTDDGDVITLSTNTEKARESISRVSEADAEQFVKLRETANELIEKIYLPQRFDEPLPSDERYDLLESSDLGETFLEWSTTPVIELLNRWFESEAMIVLMMQQMSLFGEPGEGWEAPTHAGGIARCFEGKYGYEVAQGGSETLALALQQAVQQSGGNVLTNCDVTDITVEDGRAVGVELTDGRRYRADEFVVSGVNPRLTFDEFVGFEHLDEEFVSAVESFEFEEWSTVHAHFALEEAPEYTADTADGDLANAAFQVVGADSVAELGGGMEAVMQKELPQVDWLVGNVMTNLDPTQAPEGKHVATAMGAAPYDLHGDPEEWDEGARAAEKHFLNVWQEYAPNMTEENVIASYSTTPQRIARWNPNMERGKTHLGVLSEDQMLSNHFGYRTPIDGLYMCGSSCHPGAGINGGAGYVAAKVIHEDLGIDPWWDPVDFRASLNALA